MSSPYFSDTLKSLVGYSIGIFSSDGTLVKGSLIDVKKDYLILQNKKGESFYYHLNQIKSISKNTKDLKTKSVNDDYLQAEKLYGILEHCKHRWVTINCHNDQLVTGYLSGVFEDHIILISSEEKIIMQTSHISNIFPGFYEHSDPAATDNSNKEETPSRSQTEKTSNVQQDVNEEKPQEDHRADSKTNSNSSIPNENKVQSQLREEKEEAAIFETPSSSEQDEPIIEKSTDHQMDFLSTSGLGEDVQETKNKEISTEENHTYTVSYSLEKPQEDNEPVREEKAESINYNLFDKNLRSRLSTNGGTLSTFHEHEESKEVSIKNNQTPSNSPATPSNSGNYCFRKKRSNKKLRINKRVMKRFHMKEKQTDKQTLGPTAEEHRVYIKPILTPEERERILESQYYSLMKQAEKNYINLKKKRLARESLK